MEKVEKVGKEKIPTNIMNFIRQYLDSNDLSIKGMAAQLKMPYTTLYNIVSGKVTPRRRVVLKIIKGTKCQHSLEYFGIK